MADIPTRPGSAFANGFEYDCWQSLWCEKCTKDKAFREGRTDDGCVLLLVALPGDETPEAWVDNGVGNLDRYTCTEFEAII